MYSLTTLDRLCRHLGMSTGIDDARLLAVIQAASNQVERLTHRHYTPRRATRSHSINLRYPSELALSDDLLALDAIDTNDGASIDPAQVLTLPGSGPTSSIVLRNGQAFSWQDTPLLAVNITGIWGWHSDWPSAWRGKDDSIVSSLNSSSNKVSVSQADGADVMGEVPRLQAGQLLRIDDEYLRVLAVTLDPLGADELLVQRGVNGTTAASHDLNTPIDTYQPDADIEHLVLRWAAWLYREPDARIVGDLPESLLREAGRWRRDGV